MTHVIIEITHPPFGHENTFAGLYVATASLSKGMDVTIILSGDGVYTGMKGQCDPQNMISLPATEEQVEDIIELDGRIVADNNSLRKRGISTDELTEGIEILEGEALHELILEEGDHIIAF